MISGGGLCGLSVLGCLERLSDRGFWRPEDLRRIYGTSVGAIVGVLVCLKYRPSTLREYFLRHDWADLFRLNVSTVINGFKAQGLFQQHMLRRLLEPLLCAKKVDIGVTMQEFFEFTQVDLHVYSVELETFQLVDLSHRTHPTWRLLDAVYASTAVPLVFSPHYDDTERGCFVDGALLCNYPLAQCLAQMAAEEEEDNDDVLLAVVKTHSPLTGGRLSASTSFVDFFMFLIMQLFFYKPRLSSSSSPQQQQERRRVFEAALPDPLSSAQYVYHFANSEEERQRLFDVGAQAADDILLAAAANSASQH